MRIEDICKQHCIPESATLHSISVPHNGHKLELRINDELAPEKLRILGKEAVIDLAGLEPSASVSLIKYPQGEEVDKFWIRVGFGQ